MKLSRRLWVSSSVFPALEVAIALVKSVQLEQQVEEVPLEGIQGEVGGYGEVIVEVGDCAVVGTQTGAPLPM